MTATAPTQPVGNMLREWRQRRRMSQLDLAPEAEISARHLSFVETGRARPSREMLLHLAEQLGVPLRERNLLLVAAGFAPIFGERPLDDPALTAAGRASSKCWPATRRFRRWRSIGTGTCWRPTRWCCRCWRASAALLRPPINVLRLSLQPDGLASRIVNLAEWRAHLLVRLGRQIDLTADPVLIELRRELRAYPGPPAAGRTAAQRGASDVAIRFSCGSTARRAGVLYHDDDVWDAARYHGVGAGDRVVLPGRRRYAAAVQRIAAALTPETPPVMRF